MICIWLHCSYFSYYWIFVAISIHVLLMVVKMFTLDWVIRLTDHINFSEEDTTFIFRRPLKMEEGYSSEKLLPTYQTIWRDNQENRKTTTRKIYNWYCLDAWGTANLFGMVVANLTDCTADVCFTWFYNFPVRAVCNRGTGCAFAFEIVCLTIRGRTVVRGFKEKRRLHRVDILVYSFTSPWHELKLM